jgi:signal peptidase I
MLKLLKVTENSLAPEYQEGDFVLVAKIPFFFFKTLHQGDIVVFKQPLYGTMIKKIEQLFLLQREVYVVGTHPDSIDSHQFGAIAERDLVGKVIWHIQKPEK